MNAETKVAETNAPESTNEIESIEWETPDFVEQSACAEICAYVFSAA